MTITVSQTVNVLSLSITQDVNSVTLQPVVNVSDGGFDGTINGGTP